MNAHRLPLTLWLKTWLHQTQLQDPKAPAAQNPLIGGLMIRCWKNGGLRTHTGACRANTQVTNCPLTSIRVFVPQKNLTIVGQ